MTHSWILQATAAFSTPALNSNSVKSSHWRPASLYFKCSACARWFRRLPSGVLSECFITITRDRTLLYCHWNQCYIWSFLFHILLLLFLPSETGAKFLTHPDSLPCQWGSGTEGPGGEQDAHCSVWRRPGRWRTCGQRRRKRRRPCPCCGGSVQTGPETPPAAVSGTLGGGTHWTKQEKSILISIDHSRLTLTKLAQKSFFWTLYSFSK